MDNVSSRVKLMGNLQAAVAEAVSGTMEERGRGFASDREAWAELKECIERTKQMHTDIEKVHKEMWSAVKDRNEDAFAALSQEFERSSRTQSSEVTDSDGDVAPRGGLCYYKVIIRGGVRYFKGVFHPLVKAILGNDSAATKGSSITFGTSATTFTVFRCNSGAWRITKEFTTESECIAWCDTKLGKVGG